MKDSKMKIFVFLTFLPMTITLGVLPLFPDKVPMHYNAAGEITRWGSKYEQLTLPVIVLALSGFLYMMMKFPSKREEQNKNLKASISVGIATLVLFNGMNAIFLYKAYAISKEMNGGSIDVSKLISMLMGVMFILIGNVLPKCKQNALIGIRTLWTLKDQDVWYKTHRVGGVIMIIGGIINSLVTWFFLEGIVATFFPVAVLLIITVVLSIYSYVLYRAKQKTQG